MGLLHDANNFDAVDWNKNIQLESLLTNFVHLFNFIFLDKSGNFTVWKNGNPVQSHCENSENSACSFDEERTAPIGCRPSDQANSLVLLVCL